jgi:hypothetical protein
MPAFDDVKKSETSSLQTEGQHTHDKIIDAFCANRETIAALGVTPVELLELSRASLLGSLTCEDDVLFLLRQIRAATNPTAPPPVPLESIHIPGGQSDEPTRDFGKITETIRSAALAKLDELDLRAARRRRSAIGRLELAAGRVTMTLSRMQSLVAQVSRKVARRPVISRHVENPLMPPQP